MAIISTANLIIEWVLISLLVPDPRNARQHSQQQIRQLAQSIKVFGFLIPIVIDAANKVICGHARLLAAMMLGMSEVAVIRVSHLTEAQLRAFALADNRLTEIAFWDERQLAITLKELSELNLDFSLEVTGFSMPEIDLRIESLSNSTGPDPADELPPIANEEPVSKLGDLWQLGRHWLLCGNALDHVSYAALMRGKLAQLVVADPPFNVPVHGHVGGKGRIRHREFVMASGTMTANEFYAFLDQAFHLMTGHTTKGSIHFIFMDWRHADEILRAGKANYSELKNICVWVKDNGGMGSLYRSQHEFIFVYKHGTAAHRNNIDLGRHGRSRTNVWRHSGANSFARSTEEGNLLHLHPTPKPVQLIADAILDCSARGDIVLDPFIGIGSTLIAAERVGRVCYGMELDPLYVDATIRRWQRHSGDLAVNAATGERFDDAVAAREAHHV